MCLGFSLCAVYPSLVLLWLTAGTGERAVQKQYGGSCSFCRARWLRCWLISYSLIAPSSCELLSSPSQRKGRDGSVFCSFLCNIWVLREQALPLQEQRSDHSPWARDAPAVQHHRCIQEGCLILSMILVPPTAVVLALIQAVGFSSMNTLVHSSLLPPC